MDYQYKTIIITKVGPTTDPMCLQAGRGVFNFESVLDYLCQPIEEHCTELTIDLSAVGWISLFDWCIFTSILHGQLSDKAQLRILLDLMGNMASGLIPYSDCVNYFAGQIIAPIHLDGDYRHSATVHRVLNFIKSVEGPSGFKNVAGGRLALVGLDTKDVGRPGWYRVDSEVENSVILPRTNVGTKEMCLLFASRRQIERWREAMATKRVPKAVVFHSEEFWRVLCHELARNVVEHSGGPGFIAGRVVLPKSGSLPRWCSAVYDSIAQTQLEAAKEHGFVELCVADAGRGIPATIEKSFRNRYKERHGMDISSDTISHTDLLKFAFDELGTSKDAERSWITDRHALGHMLYVIAKYGGILTVRSGNAELIYCADAGTFQRCTTQMGFEPRKQAVIHPSIRGTHIQLLIPLTAKIDTGVSDRPKISHYLPPSFHIDHRHPLGPLIPVRDKLGAFSLCIDGDETIKFKKAIRALAREILQGPHTRDQLMAFDFGEVDWTPAQFETFLYLMQNVLLTRPVLFTQVSPEFAELVNAIEDEDRPTYLLESMKEEIQQRVLEREFAGGKFLETYSGLGAVVLALGPDQGEYLFGVRGSALRAALLEIINNGEQTISGLCETYGLNSHTLEAVLNQASLLFRPAAKGRWASVFVRGATERDDLEVQRLRALTRHFDIVAVHCGAWRGRRSGRTGKKDERFYLPTEDAVYTEFLETSRILSRERYCIEVAERLIFRLSYGLGVRGLTLHDVDILACSTTPTVMLAEAIRRAWPIELADQRPVVIDYGPSLFYGADPARIPGIANSKPCAIVVHDLFDEGTLSRKLVSLAEMQGIEVLFVLTFIRFLTPENCAGNEVKTFAPEVGWSELHTMVNKPVHAMIGLRRPNRTSRANTKNWGVKDYAGDYVVDPRSLRPVPLRSLRLESGYSDERSLTSRDPYLRDLDSDGGTCRLAAGHFVYGHRHFVVVVDIRGVITGKIGYEIVRWLADVCIDIRTRNSPWEKNCQGSFEGEVTAMLLPLHSQIHYILPSLQIELAQRGWRVPHFFLDATSFGGGVAIYDVPYQLQNQIKKAADNIKKVMDGNDDDIEKNIKVKQKQLRLLFIDDAVFSSRTIQTVLQSLARHVSRISEKVYGEKGKYPGPIDWIRVFVVLNQLPASTSALWHQLNSCPASSSFRFDEYAPFIGVTTFSSADCPACRELEQLEYLTRRIQGGAATHAMRWLDGRKSALSPLTTEAPTFHTSLRPPLPEPIDVLAPPGGGAPDRYKPLHADSAIWRFYELMHLSYPLGDVLLCLKPSLEAGIRHTTFRGEYARFRLAVYDWCIHNWHQVRLYHAEDQVFDELKAEIGGGETIFVEIIHRLSPIIRHEKVARFVKWAVDLLARNDADSRQTATDITLNLDTALTLLFFALRQTDLDETNLLDYIAEKQASMHRKNSFLTILYRRLTQPTHVADPKWALTTIAEICYRGRVGDTPEAQRTTDHELLGRLVAKTERNPASEELRRRLEGCLHAFIAAESNLKPYFADYLLSKVRKDADNVLDWLRLPLADRLSDVTPLVTLSNTVQDEESWTRFAENCHMSASHFRDCLFKRLEDLKKDKPNIYNDIAVEVDISPEVERWCLMTDISKLASYISNIALEPAKRTKQLSCSKVLMKPCENRLHSITIEVITYYGTAENAGNIVATSGSIAHEISRLELFGVSFDVPLPIASGGLYFKFDVPIGFQIKR